MWTATIAAVVSAAAALGGVALSAMLSARSQTRQWDHEREQRYRDARLSATTDLVTSSSRFQELCLRLLAPGLLLDSQELRVHFEDLRRCANALRLTIRKFETAAGALELVSTAASVKSLVMSDGGLAPDKAPEFTILLASMRLREEAFVTQVRDELGLGELEGVPRYDEDVFLRAFLRKALKDEAAVQQVFEQIQTRKSRERDASWLVQ